MSVEFASSEKSRGGVVAWTGTNSTRHPACDSSPDVPELSTSESASRDIERFELHVKLGPPGCGKTTQLKVLAASELTAGVDSTRIGFWTFTRAARNELFERLGGSQDTFPWMRTIHSTAFRLLGLVPGQMLVDERWEEFGKRYGYEFSKSDPNVDDVEDLPRQTPDDVLRFVYGWGRNRRLDPRAALGKVRVRGVGVQRYEQFVRRLEGFKAEESLLDFADLLEAVLERRLCPPVEVAFLDEAQDLSPLQIAVVEMWFGACKRVYVAGDDDQTVYGFQGADPKWLGDLAQRGTLEILEQSHRVPVVVHHIAERIIQQNKARVPKTYRPADHIGRVLRLDQDRAVAMVDGRRETFVLARNRFFLAAYAKALVQRLIPFRAEGPGIHSPLTNDRLARAVNCAGRLAQPSTTAVAAQDLDALLSYVPVDGVLVKRGVKACVKQAVEAEGVFTREQLVGELNLGTLIEFIRAEGALAVLVRAGDATRRYLRGLLDRYGELPKPKVTLTTIHGAKGRGAELVVLSSDMSRATYDEYTKGGVEGFEAENRVFYVGVTRVKDTLVFVEPTTKRHYNFPSVAITGGVL